jgi:glutamate-5-semialdehyde dehydrogenase
MSATADRAAEIVERARAASHVLAAAPTSRKDAALHAIARRVRAGEREILAACAADVARAQAAGIAPALLDRLALDPGRLSRLASAVAAVGELPDPVGRIEEATVREDGLRVERVRVPLGVVLMVFESRPNVTTDAAALCVKSGNAAILRGGKEALATNRALAAAVAEGLEEAGLPRHAVQLVDDPDRALLEALLVSPGVDLAIPRGGEGLVRFVREVARVPVLLHERGVCHVFLDASAPADRATAIAVNGKARPAVCNATECLLVHAAAAERLLPAVGAALAAAGVELHAEPRALAVLRAAGVPAVPAPPDDFGREFLAPVLAVKVVDDLDAALAHVRAFGTRHTEAIVTADPGSADRFRREVDASCVVVNASTRFNDGGELGLGAELGISTSKLHAYGPMGLSELTTRKWVVTGEGHVRA